MLFEVGLDGSLKSLPGNIPNRRKNMQVWKAQWVQITISSYVWLEKRVKEDYRKYH